MLSQESIYLGLVGALDDPPKWPHNSLPLTNILNWNSSGVILSIKTNNIIFLFHDKSEEKNWTSEKIELDVKKNFKLLGMGTSKVPNYAAVMSNQNRISLHPEIVHSPKPSKVSRKKPKKNIPQHDPQKILTKRVKHKI